MLHPFGISDSAPQTSAQVESLLQAAVETIEAFARRHQLPIHYDAMSKVCKQLRPSLPWQTFGGKGWDGTWSHSSWRLEGSSGCTEFLLLMMYW